MTKSIKIPGTDQEIELNNFTVLISEDSAYARMVYYKLERKYFNSSYPFQFNEIIEDRHSPKEQVDLIDELIEKFPDIQFLFTTNSPIILSNIPNDKINIYKVDENLNCTKINSTFYKQNIELICKVVFGVTGRPKEVNSELELLGQLNFKAAFGKITDSEELERLRLNRVYQTDIII